VVEDIQDHIDHLTDRIERLRAKGRDAVGGYPTLARRFELLQTVTGIAQDSALTLLGELACLPEDMTVRQWVAHAGLDPIPDRSGTARRRGDRMSRRGNVYLRRALFFPALTAIRHNDRVKAHYQHLLGKNKPKMAAVGAIMRMLLHALFGMFLHDAPFDAAKCFRAGKIHPPGP